ncbi:hypothetical protein OG306_13405 [Streptomyces sp. NBC_01241]|uniref:hypothetical protein n=1 Tax=Streptomyces sp. NBC_01241 TaxID=2903794 RepID=UPI00352FB459|nr:hypothetical protein OG306_13405 [Streptomyces sp. NBC_01241]
MSIRTHVRATATAMAAAAVLGAALVGCTGATTSQGPGDDVPNVAPSVNASVMADAAADRPEAVRDAFAGLQTTLNDTCTPGSANCAYFLGRVNDELVRLEKAMKADGQGPAHFKEPLARISDLRKTLNGDTSTDNLEKHRSELIGTRDRINTWMQGHPEDYR